MLMTLKRGCVADLSPPPSNPSATRLTCELYARLKLFGDRGGSARPMFVGTNETAAAQPYFRKSGLHIQALTGKQPLVKLFWPVGAGNAAYADLISAIKEHHRAGGISGLIWHPNNILTGGNNYDRSRDDWDAVLACLSPGGSHLAAYRATQDTFVSLLDDCVADDGQKIPFIVRIGNETNGWRDYEDMTVTSLTRSGTTATMAFTKGANPLANQWGNFGAKFQVRGASDDKWNKIHNVVSYVKAGDSSGGTVTFTVTDGPTSNPGGTILAYPLAGDWWAGADRAADALKLWRQTIDYFRDVKGCNQLIWGLNIFTNNRLAASMDPATNPYSIWLTDEMKPYSDIVTSNLYQDEPLTWTSCDFAADPVVSSKQIIADWCRANGRPFIYTEFGALYYGRESPDFWSRSCMGAFDAKYPEVAGVCTWTPPNFLPPLGTPAAADLAQAFSNPRYVWRG